MDGDYKVVLFFSMNNRDSATGIRDVLRMEGKKIYGKTVKTVFVNVDRGDEAAKAKRDAYLKKTFKKGKVIIDETNDLCAAYRVNFLPQGVLIDGDGVVAKVAIAHKIYSQFYDAIKKEEKASRKRR
jgi:hypothetical protein